MPWAGLLGSQMRTSAGATFGLRRLMCAPACWEMTRHRGANELFQYLGREVVMTAECDGAQSEASVLLQRELSRHLPFLPAAAVASAQTVPYHAANPIPQPPNLVQIPDAQLQICLA